MRFLFGSLLAFTLIVLTYACYYDDEQTVYPVLPGGSACDTLTVTYSGTIAPIMQANCNACHNAASPGGNVITENFNGLKTAAVSGKLWGAVNHLPGFTAMPQSGSKLPDCELLQIRKWISNGTPNN